jgi:hypothetical protein
MRIARNPKAMNQSESSRSEPAAIKKVSVHTPTIVVDTPLWTTRAKPKGISRVPTHAVRPVEERRAYARAKLSLPLRLKRVAGQREERQQSLRTTNISSSGVLFLWSQRIEPGTPIEIEVCLINRPLGKGTVRMMTEAHIVRVEPSSRPGWHALAACFDDVTFQRDEPLPARFETIPTACSTEVSESE